MERINETDLRVFNASKLYAEKILFISLESYQKYLRQSDFGADNIEESNVLPEEIRNINRFNGLKAMNDVIYNLITTIKSTILLHGNKEEITQMNEIISIIEKIKLIFYNQKERFFQEAYNGSKRIEELDREYFEKIKKIIVTCYANIEILMTRNKLLFSDSKDEFASDAEIMEQIKKEYTEA